MKEFLQKAWYFGLGVFDFTREKVEPLVDEMVRRGEISQQESPEAVRNSWSGPRRPRRPWWTRLRSW